MPYVCGSCRKTIAFGAINDSVRIKMKRRERVLLKVLITPPNVRRSVNYGGGVREAKFYILFISRHVSAAGILWYKIDERIGVLLYPSYTLPLERINPEPPVSILSYYQ